MPKASLACPQVVLITGAYRGLGLETGRQLAALGWHVILSGRKLPKLKAAAAAIRADGFSAEALKLDVASEKDRVAASKDIAKRFGRLDVLVNNAAVYVEGESAEKVTLQRLREVLEINSFGPLRLTQLFLPLLKKATPGRVVMVSSGAGSLNSMGDGWSSYALSKAALNALTRMLADAGGAKLKVNAVCPGWVRTEMGGKDAPRSVEQGAKGIVWAATLGADGPTGGFFRDGKAIAW